MNAEIITIGDELLIGQVIDTNSAFIALQLNTCGITVKRRTAVGDTDSEIRAALKEAEARSQVVILTGGLGPTKDDITKKVLSEYFESQLIFDEKAFSDIEQLFINRNRQMSELNRQQAELPDKCVPLYNKLGTAPGMMFEKDQTIFFSLPGVPHEMEEMMRSGVLPILVSRFQLKPIYHKTVLTTGLSESVLSQTIEEWENSLPSFLKLAYLPSPGSVRLRLTGCGKDFEEVRSSAENYLEQLRQLIGKYIFGYDEDSLEKVIGTILKSRKKTLTVSESCTGGYISHLITAISGSSEYFNGGAVAYSNDIKQKVGVKAETLKLYGAVSEQTVLELAAASRDQFASDYAIAVSGIAGPSGGTDKKPVGLVWVGLATPERVYAKKFQFGKNRYTNIRFSAAAALEMLRRELLGIPD